MRLTGKTAIVTGAASGFGAGIARKFAEEGAQVMVVDINEKGAMEMAEDLGAGSFGSAANVADWDDVSRVVNEAREVFGGVDILVNNAGVTHMPAPMEEVSEADFDRVFDVNCKSIYLFARALVPHMKERGTGAILNVSSTAGLSPRPNLNWYNSSKGWVNTATKAMAVELAPRGIRVNAINPVAGETPLLASFMGEDTPEMRAKFLSTIPLGRFSTPEDMGNAAAFLCSEEAGMITGICMEVDGGRCI
ncbi:SDR family oxidoreductase [Aquicoccus porphyridii]|uniref:SDR family oxidoreductase n=1 Tax=Aquicoccus porphyridii TaxID=1852029 RepID=A0A5A9Z580_9RHOB|nr:SDR family oxidoreductase [Aquicoccus porphyridii]KAA0912340.1 SDR family oxidoreductase [Aquicoccus porphyridii]RAI54168.1 short chain dehydrogenase [Rhodobacteraceae bacterium AsT-22]